MGSKPENKTVAILKNSLEYFYKNGYYKKIPDPGYLGAEGQRFTPRRGIDIIYFHNDRLVGIEAKYIADKKVLPLDKVYDHQKEELETIAKNGGFGYIAIQVFKKYELNRIYFIEIFDWLHLENTWKKKSINPKDLENDYHVSFWRDVKSIKFKDGSRKQIINLSNSYLF